MGMNVTLIDKDLGYEMRCADPVPFDAEYTRDLGYAAVKFLRSEAASRGGAIISFVGGRMQPLPFVELIDPKTKRIRPRKVDIDGEAYECARRYMIRLERADFDEPQQLEALAAAAGLNVDQFRERFSRLVETL
jgi:6-phosphofructokinase 1